MDAEPDETTPLVRKENRSCCSPALKICTLTSVISLAEGYDIGVVNGAVVLFTEDLKLESWQVGIALCLFALGVALAAPWAGSLADWAGRKAAMGLASTLLICGGILMACAMNFEMLAIGRLVAGCGAGVGITAVTTYMAEVAPAEQRGFYGSLQELLVNIGNVAGYLMNFALLGVSYDWRWMLGLGIVPSIGVLIVLALPYSITGVPESPRYLQKVGRCNEAEAILLHLLNDDLEVERVINAWHDENETECSMATWGESLVAFITTHKHAAAAGIGCGIINMFTGIQLMMVTTTTLFVGTGMSKDQAMIVSIGLGATKAFVMLFVAMFLLDRWGRRPLLQTSLAVCSLAGVLGLFGTHFGESWVIVGLFIFVAGYSCGVGPVPWVYMPEVIESRFRSKGCALGLSGARLCAVTQLFSFPILFPRFGVEGVFVFLLIANLVSWAYVAALCTETSGLSLERITSNFSLKADINHSDGKVSQS